MCTMICEQANLEGSAKGVEGWFPLQQANVFYDHPFHAPWEYGVNIDFVNKSTFVRLIHRAVAVGTRSSGNLHLA